MTLRDKQVLPTVIVIVDELRAPSRVTLRNTGYAALARHVVKSERALVLKQSVALEGQRIGEQIRPMIVVIVSHVDAHSRERLPVLVVGDTEFSGNVRERSIAVVPKQLL